MLQWVETEAKRANRNLMLVNGFVLIALLGTLGANWQYCVNFVLGCQPIQTSELSALTSPSQRFRNFVIVHGLKSVSTGYQDIERSVEKSTNRVVSEVVKDEYLLLLLGDKVLLVKAPDGKEVVDFSGELIPTSDAIRREVIAPIAASHPTVADGILPFTLDTTDYRDQGYWGFGLGIPLVIVSLWNCLTSLRRGSEVSIAPIWKQLSIFGNVAQLSQEIQQEQNFPVRKYGRLAVTQSWLIKRGAFSTWVSPVSEVVWTYKKMTKHSVNFIPTGKTYAAILYGRHRQRLEVSMSEKSVNELLADLAGRVPWAVFGYDKGLEQAWTKDTAGFIAAVDSRRQAHAPKADAAAGS
jgi:hypothetical protein